MKLETSVVLPLTVLALLAESVVSGYSILGVFPHTGRSHFDVFQPLMKELARRGHRVTVISHFPQKTPPPGYEDVSLRNTGPIRTDVFDMSNFKLSRFEQYYDVVNLMNVGQSSCESGFSARSLKDFVHADRKFDVIIAEFFSNEWFLGIVHKFRAPLIGISSCVMFPWDNDVFGNPSNPAYIPNNFLPLADDLTFMERVENAVLPFVQNVVVKFFMDGPNNRVAKEFFGGDLPVLRDIAFNASLLLVNSHFSLNRPRPLVPAVIEVGGLHIGAPKRVTGVNINIGFKNQTFKADKKMPETLAKVHKARGVKSL